MQDITKIAEQLNARVAQLNNERSRQLGMQEAAKKQYDNALAAYETKYGVKLTEQNLQEEYNKVYAEVKGKVAVLQESIQAIERGDYKNIERPADLDLEPNVAPIMPVSKVQEVAKPAPITSAADISSKERQNGMVSNFGIPYGSEVVQPINERGVKLVNEEGKIAPPPIVVKKDDDTTVIVGGPVIQPTPIVNPINVSGDDDKPFWETSTPVVPSVEPVVQPTINFGGVAAPQTPAFGGTPLNLQVEDSFDDDGYDDYIDEDDLPKPPTFNQPVSQKVDAPEDEDDNDDEVITPNGWGLPKTDDINKNFQDILGQSGIKFGE